MVAVAEKRMALSLVLRIIMPVGSVHTREVSITGAHRPVDDPLQPTSSWLATVPEPEQRTIHASFLSARSFHH